MQRSWRRRIVLATLVAGSCLAACGSDEKPKSGITIETLAASQGTACPVPLEVSADNSGIDTPSPATGSVIIGHVDESDTTPTTAPLSALDAADGVAVSCTLPLADGSAVELYLVAARTDAAGEVVVPVAAQAGDLSTNQATQLLNDATRTKVGELVPVPGSDAVAMIITSVGGAASAALVLEAPTLKRPQVEQIARQLDQRLH